MCVCRTRLNGENIKYKILDYEKYALSERMFNIYNIYY